ncbi:MAG: DciA family protein [Kiritimatiellae bacterium]|nr:DciA family protein [Kiritimatiellia bacterium]
MRKGKHQFDSAEEPAPENVFFDSKDDDSAFCVRKSAVRRELTERDKRHNRGVRRLLNNVIPGLPIDHDPPETRQAPENMAGVVEKIKARLKIKESPWMNRLTEAWPDMVPPGVAKVARPGKWDNNTLYIYVDSSPHLFEIRRAHLKNIEKAVKALVGGDRVRHVRLIVNSVTLP